jgi:hypothetical protein
MEHRSKLRLNPGDRLNILNLQSVVKSNYSLEMDWETLLSDSVLSSGGEHAAANGLFADDAPLVGSQVYQTPI